jgi:hypothetical protein
MASDDTFRASGEEGELLKVERWLLVTGSEPLMRWMKQHGGFIHTQEWTAIIDGDSEPLARRVNWLVVVFQWSFWSERIFCVVITKAYGWATADDAIAARLNYNGRHHGS